MKIKTILAFTSLIVLAFTAKCQKITYDFSEAKNTNKTFYGDGVQTKTGRIVLKENVQSFGGLIDIKVEKKASILLLNDKLETIKETPVSFKNSMFIDVKGLYQLHGKTILVYAYKYDKKDEQYIVSAIKLNEQDNSYGQEVELGRFETTSGRSIPGFELNASADSSMYLLFAEADQKKKELKQFYFGVFNSDLNKQYERKVVLPVEKRFVVIESTTLDKNANLFVEYKYFKKEVASRESIRDEEFSTPAYSTVLSQFTADSKSSTDIDLNIPGKHLHNASLLFNKDSEKIGIAGTYKNDAEGRVSGIFYAEYDPAFKKVTSTKLSEIPIDVIDLFETEDIASNGKKHPGISGNFKSKRFSNRLNGSIDYTLEYNRSEERSTAVTNASGNVTGGINSYYKFYSGSILNVNIDKNGKFIYTRIPKDQSDENYKAYISHFSFYNGNKLIFLYNDDKDNAERDLNKKPADMNMDKHSRKSVLTAAVIDEKGNLQRQVIYEHGDDKYITVIPKFKLLTINTIFAAKTKTGSVMEDIRHQKYGVIEIK